VTVIAVLLAFVAGVGVGFLVRDRWETIHNRKDTMRHALTSSAARLLSSRRLGLTLVTLALLANALLGFLLIATRAAQADDRDRFEELVLCVERYNRTQGDALTSRDSAIRSSADAEIRLWREYVRLFDLAQNADEAGDEAQIERIQVEFYDTVREYVDGLEETREARSENPYPDPDLCLEEARRE
jgi:hypothetical protein